MYLDDDVHAEVNVDDLQTDTAGEAVPTPDDSGDAGTPDPVVETDGQERDPETGQFRSTKAEKRIAELTREREDAKRDAQFYKNLAEQKQLVTQPTEPPAVQPPQVEATEAPKQEDFQSWEDYYAALAEHKANEAVSRLQSKQAEDQSLATQQKAQNDFNERAAVFAREHEDFQEKVLMNTALAISPEMAQAIYSSENGPEVAYYLGNNPALAQQISMRPPLQQAVEIGRIHGLLSTAPRSTQTPPPIEPVKGAETPARDWMSDPNISNEEWARRRNEAIAKDRIPDARVPK